MLLFILAALMHLSNTLEGAVVSVNKEATQAGIELLQSGGNVIFLSNRILKPSVLFRQPTVRINFNKPVPNLHC